jgi:hypothetical protein
MKQYSRFIFVFSAVFVFFLAIAIRIPDEIDWTLSFSKTAKIPYGAYVLYSQLPVLFDARITATKVPFDRQSDAAGTGKSSYIFLTDEFRLQGDGLSSLLNYVKKGNRAFIAANAFGVLRDSLQFRILGAPNFSHFAKVEFTESTVKSPEPFYYPNQSFIPVFHSLNEQSSTILATFDEKPILIKIRYGNGIFYLCSFPLAFTNFHTLDSTHFEFPFRALSYLPMHQAVYWDEYYKPVIKAGSPIRYILGQPALSMAYYIAALTIILYIVFAGKRRQRIIRIIKPLSNATLEFVKAVGELYYYSGDHKNIAEKKITYFFERIRSHYHLQMDDFNAGGLEVIAAKSGIDLPEVRQTYAYLSSVLLKKNIPEAELFKINTLIESFYRKANLHG